MSEGHPIIDALAFSWPDIRMVVTCFHNYA
jgi:hypothetical protein